MDNSIITTNVEVGELGNWFDMPFKYKDKLYVYHDYYIDCNELVLINSVNNEEIRISNKSNYFTVIDHKSYIELIDEEVS